MQTRVVGIDAARGAAACLVVYYHASTFVTDDARAVSQLVHQPGQVINWMAGAVRMALLMFVSGYLGRSALADAAKSRLRAIQCLWIYTLWSVITLALAADFHAIPHQLYEPTTSLWYMWDLGFAYLTLPLIQRAPKGIVMGVFFLLAMYFETQVTPPAAGVLRNAARYVLFFYIGVFYGDAIVGAVRDHPWRSVTFSLSVAALTHWIDSSTAAAGLRLLIVPERLACAVVALTLAFALPAATGELLARVGRAALPIYLGHPVLLPWAYAIARTVGFDLFPSLATPIAITLSIIAYRMASRIGWDALYRYPAEVVAGLRLPALAPAR